MNLQKVYHVGFLSLPQVSSRPQTSYSLEGDGLSISLNPLAWRKIAKLGGSDIYLLSKDSPNFLFANEDNNQKAISWCVENEFLYKAKKYRAHLMDDCDTEFYLEADSYSEAIQESDEVTEVHGYIFGPKGKKYWQSFCSSKVNNALAEAFAVIFYAEAMGYDGVWWNEVLDPEALSAPRGVIFQHKINEWKIELITNDDHL